MTTPTLLRRSLANTAHLCDVINRAHMDDAPFSALGEHAARVRQRVELASTPVAAPTIAAPTPVAEPLDVPEADMTVALPVVPLPPPPEVVSFNAVEAVEEPVFTPPPAEASTVNETVDTVALPAGPIEESVTSEDADVDAPQGRTLTKTMSHDAPFGDTLPSMGALPSTPQGWTPPGVHDAPESLPSTTDAAVPVGDEPTPESAPEAAPEMAFSYVTGLNVLNEVNGLDI